MPSTEGRSILHCIHQYQDAAVKRRKAQPGVEAPAVTTSQISCGKVATDRHEPPCGKSTQGKGCNLAPERSLLVTSGSQPLQVRANNFYGKNRQLLIDQRVAHFQANVQLRLHSKTVAPFEQFPLQKQAFAWAAEHELAVSLSYDGVWQRYRDMLPNHRHYYEIIQELYPSHLYFDLEYKKEYNESIDGEKMVDRLLELIAKQLQAIFHIDFEPGWVMELESDSQHKFSRHLIIQIPGKAFAHNLHVGFFVNEVCKAAVDTDTGVSSLQVAKEHGTSSIVDTGVYTRNRAFRLYLSSKAGKTSILTPTGRFPNKAHSQKQIFMQSLICNVAPDAQLLYCRDEHAHPQSHGRQHTRAPSGSAVSSQGNIGPSPCPALDAFVASVCNQGGEEGSVRSWVLWEDLGTILYNIKNNRWCGNIGRAHKSNGIYIIVDLQGGVWYQRCYDPDCRAYRSETMPLPPELTRCCQAAIARALDSNRTGFLANHDDSEEAAMLAAWEQYESAHAKC